MSEFDSKYTAQNLMAVHGLRAQAVVHERLTEARQQGDTSGLERWQNVEAAISELRRTCVGPRHTALMAGAGGIEPPYDGIKIRCLTAWRRPNVPP